MQMDLAENEHISYGSRSVGEVNLELYTANASGGSMALISSQQLAPLAFG